MPKVEKKPEKRTPEFIRGRAENGLKKFKPDTKNDDEREKIKWLNGILNKSDDEIQNKNYDEEMDKMEIEYELAQQDQEGSSNASAGNPAQQDQGSSSNTPAGNPAQQDQGSSSNASAGNPAQQDQGSSSNTPSGNPAQQDQGSSNMQSADNANIKKEPHDDEMSPFVAEKYSSEYDSTSGEDEYGPALFFKPESEHGSNGVTVGWCSFHGRTYINRYGPKNAGRYRLERDADTADYEDHPPSKSNVSDGYNRYGDRKRPGGKYVYTKRHFRGIFAVAWAGAGLSHMDPEEKRKRWTITYALTAWMVEKKNPKTGEMQNVVKKVWEPRTVIRRLFGKVDGDKNIYIAACAGEVRYDEFLAGTRPALKRSPSVDLIPDATRKLRAQSTDADQTASAYGRSSSTSKPDELDAKIREFEQDLNQYSTSDAFKALPPDRQALFLLMLKLERTNL
jgi:hypothetical protein